MRRFLGQKPPPPTADSTPFLCSCAKKRGGAPKKRAFGCHHGGCWVPPASPTDSKPQHHHRLRQADLSARSTTKPLPKSGEDDPRPPRQKRSREWWSRQGKKALFFGGSTPFLWASTKEMGSNRRTSHRPPPNVSAHTYKSKKGGTPGEGSTLDPLLRFYEHKRVPRSAERGQGRCPCTPPPLKRRAKLSFALRAGRQRFWRSQSAAMRGAVSFLRRAVG